MAASDTSRKLSLAQVMSALVRSTDLERRAHHVGVLPFPHLGMVQAKGALTDKQSLASSN